VQNVEDVDCAMLRGELSSAAAAAAAEGYSGERAATVAPVATRPSRLLRLAWMIASVAVLACKPAAVCQP
jgi:hypothetical protein